MNDNSFKLFKDKCEESKDEGPEKKSGEVRRRSHSLKDVVVVLSNVKKDL